MTLIRTILGELIGLFVDDGNLATLCVALIAIATALAKLVPGSGIAAVVVLLVGCPALLCFNVYRGTRKR